MGAGATGLCINPVMLHHENIDVRLEPLKEMVLGQKIGCCCITEPEVLVTYLSSPGYEGRNDTILGF